MIDSRDLLDARILIAIILIAARTFLLLPLWQISHSCFWLSLIIISAQQGLLYTVINQFQYFSLLSTCQALLIGLLHHLWLISSDIHALFSTCVNVCLLFALSRIHVCLFKLQKGRHNNFLFQIDNFFLFQFFLLSIIKPQHIFTFQSMNLKVAWAKIMVVFF